MVATATATAIAFAAPIVAELATDHAVQLAGTQLRSRSLRRRVAKAASREAALHGVTIPRQSLRQWLSRDDVQDQLRSGIASKVESAVGNLAWRLTDVEPSRRDELARTLLAIVLYHVLKESEPSAAAAFSHRWMSAQLVAHVAEVRAEIDRGNQAIVEVLNADNGFDEDLRTFHPWRQDEARALVGIWPAIRSVVHTLAAAGIGRRGLLVAWSEAPPTTLDGAPPEAWTWLGHLSSDYGSGPGAATFFLRAVDGGAHPRGYWLARAAMALAESDRERAKELAHAGRDHPLSRIIEAELAKDGETAAAEVTAWQPTSLQERSIRDVAQSRVLFDRGEVNAAIAYLREQAQATPEASGIATAVAELLLRRAAAGTSDRPSDDAQEALTWAIKARNSRRAWRGDSAGAVVVALRATGLLHDLTRGFRLTQPAPNGEATAAEAAHPDVMREAAILSVMTGRDDLAADLADRAADPYASAFVEAVIASRVDGQTQGVALWTRTYDLAPSDTQRAQTAFVMFAHTGQLPDLTALGANYPVEVAELRGLQQLPVAPSERLAALRTRAHESTRMTVELASYYAETGDEGAAGQALEDGANRWADPIMMRMAAAHFRQARDQPAVQRTAEAALRLAPSNWAGEIDARKLLFEALWAQGHVQAAAQEAGRLVALDPQDADARWANVYCLAREGDLEGAWSVLTPDGNPIAPRNREDVRSWVALLTRFDRSPNYLRRVLDVMTRWQDDEEVVGVCMTQVYLGLDRYGHETAEADIAALHRATERYVAQFPESNYFRAVAIDPEDPLAVLAEDLESRHDAVNELEAMVRDGQVPVGMAGRLVAGGYTEAALQRLGGIVRSHDISRAIVAAGVVETALDENVVLDVSAAATLALLTPELADLLTGRFRRLETTDVDLNDAMNAQTKFELRSDFTVVWDHVTGAPRPVMLDPGQVEALATRSQRVTTLLTSCKLNARPDLTTIHEIGDDDLAASLTTLDYAAETGLPFWCDDLTLAAVAAQHGVATFGTVDLLRQLVNRHTLDPQLEEAAEATLICNFHVDLGFQPRVIRLAAELDSWRPAGAAFSLSRPPAWADAEQTMNFLLDALERCAGQSPGDIRGWTGQAAVGLCRGVTSEQAGHNLRVLLRRLLPQAWLTPDRFPAVLAGVRNGLEEQPAAADPLEPVLRELHEGLVERNGHAAAAALLMAKVQHAADLDRQAAVRIVLEP